MVASFKWALVGVLVSALSSSTLAAFAADLDATNTVIQREVSALMHATFHPYSTIISPLLSL